MKKNLQPLFVAFIALIVAVLLSFLLSQFSSMLKGQAETRSSKLPKVVISDPRLEPNKHAAQAKKQEIKKRFEQAVVMLHAQQYDYAVKALHRVIELAPRMPEAHVNLGYAFLGGGDAKSARDFFMSAIDLKQDQMNAYYGLAIAAEKLNDIEMALGAMRTYVHLSPKDDPYRARARSALWEWQEARKQDTKMYQKSSTSGTPVSDK